MRATNLGEDMFEQQFVGTCAAPYNSVLVEFSKTLHKVYIFTESMSLIRLDLTEEKSEVRND
jgi:hypothetical protein